MHSFSSLPGRRRRALGLNLILVGGLWVLFLLLAVNLVQGEEGFVMLSIIFLSLPFVALFQFACLIYNLTQGSKIQFWYLIGSLAFLTVYISSIYGLTDYFDKNSEELGIILLTATPITCATVFCFLLYIDHPNNYPKKTANQDALDGGLDLF